MNKRKVLEVYEKYKYMDSLLSNKAVTDNEFLTSMLYDFWTAIKTEIGQEKLP